jgi:hypothetical protein
MAAVARRIVCLSILCLAAPVVMAGLGGSRIGVQSSCDPMAAG